MNHPQLVCGDCGQEVRQEGAYLKCQNWDCKMEIPIDVEQIRGALAAANEEVSRQSDEQ